MGKTNKANRTKGNTRPSSSANSAQLLNLHGGRALTGFIGFDALEKETPSYVPVTGQHTTDATDNTVDSDFRMVMRKMLKRDAVTRLKAMQEFGEHCVEKDVDIVKNVLPFWPRLFNRLALDTDRRIREATHQANGKLLSKVKRDVAPYLKNIMSVWLLGQCDLYAPSASAAQTTFSNTFPSAKQSEALMFCKNEIFSYFKDNLFEQTAKSMSEPNSTTPEDSENKYILVISATFQALKLFLTIVQQSEQSNIQEDFYSVVANKKFWKFAKNNEAQIRGSWYTLISSICQLQPQVFSDMEKKLVTTVFSCLSESDPMVAPSVWESALNIVVSFENCWEGVDIQKVALPQLWALLKEGGKGNARALFPCLLPFLSKLPKDTVESESFLLQFFSCFRQSLMLPSVKVSSIECDAILGAFFECLQFICCTRLGNVSAGPQLLGQVLKNEIIPIVDSSLYQNQCSHLALSRLYPLLGSLLQKIECQCLNPNQDVSRTFSEVLKDFWENMLPIVCVALDSSGKGPYTLTYLSYFFNSLFQPSDNLIKKEKKSVRFEDDDNVSDEMDVLEAEISKAENPSKHQTITSLSNKNSQSFSEVLKFCELLCEKIDEDCQFGYLRLLEEILDSATSEDFVTELITVFSIKRKLSPNSASSFLKEVFLKWISKTKDPECFHIILNSVYIICSSAPEDEAISVLDYCSEMNITVLEKLLELGFMEYRSTSFFQTWLKKSVWCATTVKSVKELLKQKKLFLDRTVIPTFEAHHRILNICLRDDGRSNLLNMSDFENIVLLLMDITKTISSLDGKEANMCVVLRFLQDVILSILRNYKICWHFNAVEDLLCMLYSKNLSSVDKVKVQMTPMLQQMLDGIIDSYFREKGEIANEKGLIFRIATELSASMQSIEFHRSVQDSQLLCSSLLCAVKKTLTTQAHETSSALFVSYKLLDAILPSNTQWDTLKEQLNIPILPTFLKRKMFYPLSIEEKFSYPEKDVQTLTFLCDVVSGILTDPSLFSCNSDEETNFCVHYYVEQIPQILWCLTFCKGTKTVSEGTEDTFLKRLEEKCLEMLSSLTISEIVSLKQKILQLSNLDGQWSLCLQLLGEIFPQSNLAGTAEAYKFDIVSNLEMTESMYMIHQVLIPYLPTEQKRIHMKHLLLEIMDMEDLTNNNFGGLLGELCCCLQDEEMIYSEEVQGFVKTLFATIIKYDYKDREDLRFTYHLQLISLFSSSVLYGLSILSEDIWEFFLDLLSALIEESKSNKFDSPQDIMQLHEVLTLFTSASRFIQNSQDNPKYTNQDLVLEKIPHEIYENMVLLFLHISDVFLKLVPLPEMCEKVLSDLLGVIELMPGEQLLDIVISHETEDGDNPTICALTSSLASGVRQLQFAAHSLLLKIAPLLAKSISDELKSKNDDVEEDTKNALVRLEPLIQQLVFLNDLVESMLLDWKIGDLCTVVPHTDSYVFSMAYLLAWIEMLEFISASPSQVRLSYATVLEDRKLLSPLFFNAFCFMPENPLLCLKRGLKLDTPKKEDLKLLFIQPPVLSSNVPSSEEIQSIACYVFATALRKVPASIRTWWNNLDRKSADIVNNFTSKYVSGILCVAEIQAVHENEKQFENLMVQARPGSREVIATYTIDDCAIELGVQLPTNFPLGPICAERRGKVVIGQLEWRHWLMQLTTVLTYQNGSILDGLTIWKRNLDKKFEGVEECMICYYILHSSTLKLPKLSCHVCRKKFHSACLYKWFRTSNNSTCPLCRNEFYYM